MNPETIIQQLAAEPSTLARERIIRTCLGDGNRDFFDGVKLAYDKGITFGVSTKAPEKGTGKGLTFYDFVGMVQPLIDRETTGDDAIGVLTLAAAKATPEQWEFWYRPIVVKNLDCGTTSTLINKVLKAHGSRAEKAEFMVPVFECQLATDIKKVSEANQAKLGDVLVQPKLDGVRVLARVSKKGTILFSRNGKIFHNFPRIEKDLSDCFGFGRSVIWIDGEVVSKDFRALMTQANRKENVETKDCTFAIFDSLPDPAFKAGFYDAPNKARHATLERIFADHATDTDRTESTSLSLVSSTTLNYQTDQAKIQALVRAHLEQGYEGTMIKDAEAPYAAKRTKAWIKIKPTIMLTLKIVDVVEGKGKYVGTVGALTCEGTYEGKAIKVSVGGGINDDQRKEFWANKDKLIGHLVEVQADSVSQSQDGEYSLRFPRLLWFRGTEAGEKF